MLLDFVCKINDDHGYVSSPAQLLHVDLRWLGSGSINLCLFHPSMHILVLRWFLVGNMWCWFKISFVSTSGSNWQSLFPIFKQATVFSCLLWVWCLQNCVYHSYMNGLLEQGNRSYILHDLVSFFIVHCCTVPWIDFWYGDSCDMLDSCVLAGRWRSRESDMGLLSTSLQPLQSLYEFFLQCCGPHLIVKTCEYYPF